MDVLGLFMRVQQTNNKYSCKVPPGKINRRHIFRCFWWYLFIFAALRHCFWSDCPQLFLPGPLLGAVFAGVTNTPLACIFMGIELFGVESGVFIALAVVMAYLFSGHTGIYGSQVIGSPKHLLLGRERGRALHDL